jgi:hypothetical protein
MVLFFCDDTILSTNLGFQAVDVRSLQNASLSLLAATSPRSNPVPFVYTRRGLTEIY